MQRYRQASTLGKIFVWLSVLIVIVYIVIYIQEVREALAMDPMSYECLHDSMMKQICADPYGSSVTWGIVSLVFYCWPLIMAWLVMGVMLLIRRGQRKKQKATTT